jgi:hypothetical protein
LHPRKIRVPYHLKNTIRLDHQSNPIDESAGGGAAGCLLFHGGTSRVGRLRHGGYGSRIRWDLGAVRLVATDGDQVTSQAGAGAADVGRPQTSRCFKMEKMPIYNSMN